MPPRPQKIPCLLYNFAATAAALVAHKDTPNLIRREVRKLTKELKRKLPKRARREIAAAEAEAAIKASGYLLRSERS